MNLRKDFFWGCFAPRLRLEGMISCRLTENLLPGVRLSNRAAEFGMCPSGAEAAEAASRPCSSSCLTANKKHPKKVCVFGHHHQGFYYNVIPVGGCLGKTRVRVQIFLKKTNTWNEI
jgi:hypothetical protein